MRYTEQQLLSACMTYRHDFGLLSQQGQEDVRGQMAQILEHMPEADPASPPDRLPVPGAAVRALAEAWRKRDRTDLGTLGVYNGGLNGRDCASELEAALVADGLASQELPTREAVYVGLRKAYDDNTYGTSMADAWESQTDYVLSLLARRSATDEAEALRRAIGEAIDVLDLRPTDAAPAADTWWLVEGCKGVAGALEDCHERIADLESQLASVTKERDCLRDPNDPHNDARRFEARLQQEIADGKRLVRERDQLRAELEKTRSQISEALGLISKAFAAMDPFTNLVPAVQWLLSREALMRQHWRAADGELMKVRAELEKTRAELADCQARLKGTLALADERSADKARVEHELLVVRAELDDTKALLAKGVEFVEQDIGLRAELDKTRAELERVRGHLEVAEKQSAGLFDHANSLTWQIEALRAGVASVLPGGGGRFTMAEPERLAASGWHDTAYAIDYLGAILKPAPQGEPQLIDQLVDQSSPAFLRSKLEATEEIAAGLRAELEACKRNADDDNRRANELGNRLIEAREQYEALRAACERWFAAQSSAECDAAYAALRALLKPAPADSMDDWARRKVLYGHDAPPASAEAEPAQHPPPESAMVEQVRRLELRLSGLDYTLRTFLADWARGSFNKARAAEVLEALDARRGAGK